MKKSLIITLIILAILFMAYRAYASSVGPNNGSTATNIGINGRPLDAGGGDSWVNINNSKVVDGSFANGSVCASCDGATALDVITGFGFNIPSNATINGIIATITRKYQEDGLGTCGSITDNLLYLDYSNATSSLNKADTVNGWPLVSTAKDYGSSSDLWGGTWTAIKINDSTFGVAFSANECYNGLPKSNPYVDGITLTVYYTVSGTPQVQIRQGQMSIKSGQMILK